MKLPDVRAVSRNSQGIWVCHTAKGAAYRVAPVIQQLAGILPVEPSASSNRCAGMIQPALAVNPEEDNYEASLDHHY